MKLETKLIESILDLEYLAQYQPDSPIKRKIIHQMKNIRDKYPTDKRLDKLKYT